MKQTIEFSFTNAPAKRVQSELMAVKADVINNTNNNTRSFSSYFREFRRQHVQIRKLLELKNERGVIFNAALVTQIIGAGDQKPIIAADEALHAAAGKIPDPTKWSGKRIYTAFLHAVEIPKEKKNAK